MLYSQIHYCRGREFTGLLQNKTCSEAAHGFRFLSLLCYNSQVQVRTENKLESSGGVPHYTTSVQSDLVPCVLPKNSLQWCIRLEKNNQHPVDLHLYYFVHV